ncbi:MAG: class I SAM-dependent RNA methyltransferase [Bacteroidetes bacterium]|nr:class I SAM-dependent RNA methyltransferase [Bacteroidota bacterium]
MNTNTQDFLAKTMHGLEPVLAAELETLGATDIRQVKRAVVFKGDKRILYAANYQLRTALRILIPIASFQAQDEKSLYEGIRTIDWQQYLKPNQSLAVDAITSGNFFKHSHFVALLVKDAIVDQFRDLHGRRPDVNTVTPHLRIQIHISGESIDVSLDSSGDSLHRRGYRADTVPAPLNEVLAAGMILLSGWDANSDFVDPMCGSGTLPIEAAWIATATPPQYLRPSFGFFRWSDFDEKLWKSVKSDADASIKPCPVKLYAGDKDPRARNATSINLMQSGMEKNVRVQSVAFEKLLRPSNHGVLIANPPYDERMQVSDIRDFYQSMGDRLKKQWAGWDAWIISSNRDALKSMGLRTARRLALFNGAMECGYYKYEMYEGTKRLDDM